jgi:hypothetical protein
MKKLVRIIIAVCLFLPSFPIISLGVSMLGLATCVFFFYMIAYPIFYFGNDEHNMMICKEASKMFFMPLVYPFYFWYYYIKAGKIHDFNEE